MRFLCALAVVLVVATACRGGGPSRPAVTAFRMSLSPVVAVPPAAVRSRPVEARPDSFYVPILVYHGVYPHTPNQTAEQRAFDVAPEKFVEQMEYLRDSGYRVISLPSFIDALEKREPIPAKSVIITFDDGRRSQYVHAYPVLKRLGFTATFFVYPNPLARSHPDFMTWDQLRELQTAGMTIASHTRTHPKLTKIQDPKQLTWELTGSRTLLEMNLRTKVDLIAFPYGLHNAQVDSMVKVAGYRAARKFSGGGWNSSATMSAMRSIQITDNMNTFKRVVRGR